jgi:hypothetical protein
MEVVYDIETFPNVFTACFKQVDGPGVYFEISDRRRDNYTLWHYIMKLDRMIGFNNMGFDWPVLDTFLRNPNCDAAFLYQKAMSIIGSEDNREKMEHVIWTPYIPQIDLYMINHFNNKAKSTSLKKLQFNMRSTLVQDMPIPVGTHLSFDEIDILLSYNAHDVTETEKFYKICRPAIELREALEPFWINQSDTGLGRKYFERELDRAGVPTFSKDANGRRQPLTTPRPHGVSVGAILLPYLQFRTPVINDALKALADVHVIDTTDDEGKMKRIATTSADGKAFTEYEFELAGVAVTMGLGGLHGSVERRTYVDGQDIEDLDVTSFYPSIAIVNRLYPEHLGSGFCDVYAELLRQRLLYAKGTPENAAIKLALNSVFGSSGSPYTAFYDIAFMLAITINGQFLILSLAELLLSIEGVELIQINTDGLTIVIPPDKRPQVKEFADAWAKATLLKLECNTYTKMWIRDVNNYIAEYANGKRKRKGAYEPNKQWHQNQSMPIIRSAAEAAMCDGVDIEDYIQANDSNGFDFMLRLDMGKNSRLVLDNGDTMNGVVRYYVGTEGHKGIKYTNKTKTRMHAKGHANIGGTRKKYTCSECDGTFLTKKAWETHADETHASRLVFAQQYNGEAIDYDIRFYANEARKLVL